MSGFGVLLIVVGFIFIFIGRSMEADERELMRSYFYKHRSRYNFKSNRPKKPRYPRRATSPPPPPPKLKQPTTGKPGAFAQAQVGTEITFTHPQRGQQTVPIIGTIKYIELWQTSKGSSVPWTPTGNVFTAHWTGETLIYGWKGQIWLLDNFEELTDADVRRNFMPHAREFGQSDETADVYFAYPPGSWKITDIGKFEVQSIEGEGLRLQADAIGRFIHARGGTTLENRVLVVEDYQDGAGGLDTAWRGWQISWDNVEIADRATQEGDSQPSSVAAPLSRNLDSQEPSTDQPINFAQAQVGAKIVFPHPQLGTQTTTIQGTIEYQELWQTTKGANTPWTPTGNIFTAHWTGEMLLYAWKGQIWLLDRYDELTDADIKRDFLPHAREFGQSNETADVYFAYPPGSWKITDIGKFSVRALRGEGLRLQSGAVGRFIHAQGGTTLEGRVLVIEDYQDGGGGLDTAWRGWKIRWDDIEFLA